MISRESLDRLATTSPNRILDTHHLYTLFGDVLITQKFGDIIVNELPKQLDLLKRHIHSSNVREIHKCAHRLKSTLGWFKHSPSLRNLCLLESITDHTPFYVYKETFNKLELDICTLLTELEQHLR